MDEQIGVAYFPVWGGAGQHAKQSQASATVVPGRPVRQAYGLDGH
jgi:hypothetical protein